MSRVVQESSPSISQNVIFSSSLARRITIEDVRFRGNVAQVRSDDSSVLAELLNISISVVAPGGWGRFDVVSSVNVEFSS